MPHMDDDCDRDEAIVSDVELLSGMFPDVSVLPSEPNVEPIPVVQIQYTAPFRHVMGLYRHLGSIIKETNSPRWLLLLAFVLRKCPAHYSAWKHRRDVVLTPGQLSLCSREQFTVPQANRSWGYGLSAEEREAVARWCPPLHATTSLWLAVQWELQATRYFALTNPKNFQIWHHRDELISRVLASKSELESEGPLAYSELLRELDLCTHVHVHDDSKNYHVWSHRAWFLALFSPIALRWTFAQRSVPGPLLTVKAVGDGIPTGGELAVPVEDIARSESFDVHLRPMLELPDEREMQIFPVGARLVAVDDSCVTRASLLNELRVTADFINSDHFNNSAWAHRFMLIRDHVLARLWKEDVALAEHVCVGEIRLAIRWCRVCPCNESSLVYARSISELFCTSGGRPQAEAWRLHQELAAVLHVTVQPRLECLMRSFSQEASDSNVAPLEFLKRNVFQLTAARYQIFRDIAGAMWEMLSPQDKELVSSLFPPTRFLESNGETEATGAERSELVRALLSSEAAAVACLKELVSADTIRSKYWKAELSDVIHREYSR